MKALKRILLAVDLNDPVQEAVQTCTAIATRFDSQVTLMHVIDPRLVRSGQGQWNRLRVQAANHLQAMADFMRSESIDVAEPVIASGTAYEQIIHHAESVAVNLIIVGAGGQADGVCVGSTAEQLVRRSPKPVWVVRDNIPAQARCIVCPVDFSAPSVRALKNAVHLARRFDAGLQVLHVVEPVSFWFNGTPSGEASNDAHASVHAKLAQVLGGVDHEGVSVEVTVREGRVAREIVAACCEHGADLLVMGSAGRTGLDRVFIGSVATKVLRQMPCSMVTVKGEHVVRAEFDSVVADFDARFQRGIELSRNGFADEALEQFERCLDESPVSPQVWQAMADVYDKIGDQAQVQECLDRAAEIARTIENERIQAEIRREHALWGS